MKKKINFSWFSHRELKGDRGRLEVGKIKVAAKDLFEHFRRISSFGITLCVGKHALSPQPEIRAYSHERTKA